MSKAFYLTTTLPYVNAEPHIGFALEIVQADALAQQNFLFPELARLGLGLANLVVGEKPVEERELDSDAPRPPRPAVGPGRPRVPSHSPARAP